jgi:hypothetical protein
MLVVVDKGDWPVCRKTKRETEKTMIPTSGTVRRADRSRSRHSSAAQKQTHRADGVEELLVAVRQIP